MPVKLGNKITMTRDGLSNLVRSIRALADTRVMVGIPMETSDRHDDGEITNAEIGYIQEHGAPETNLPPRPHLFPTMRAQRDVIVRRLKVAGVAALRGDLGKMETTLEGLGLTMAAEVKKTIVAVLPPPLAEVTVRRRIARRKSPSWRRRKTLQVEANLTAGKAAGEGLFTPLIDTGNYLAHLTYVLRSKRTGNDKVVGPSG